MTPVSTSELAANSSREIDGRKMGEGHPKPKDVIAVALIIGAVVAVFWRVIFTDAMFFYRDVFSYTYPHARFVHESLGHGYWPYWNPYMNYGEPVLSNPNFLFFYPYTLLIILLPIDFAYTLHYVVHFALAGIGTYWLARRWQQTRVAALFGALVFALSGPVLSLGSFYNHAACAAWIPWALLVADYAIESHSLRPWILLTLIFTLQLLAGEPFTLFATFGLVIAYAIHRSGNIRQPLGAVNLRILGRFIAVACVMVALAAVQFLPSLGLLRDSRRGLVGLPYAETTSWSFHPLFLLETLLPDFFGDSLNNPSLWTTILSCRNRPYLPVVFIGFVPLFFALAGWALGHDRRRNFTALSALTFLSLSFGRFTPVFSLAYLLFPPLELVRFPVKLLIPAVLLASLLAGWGVDSLRSPKTWVHPQRARIAQPLELLLAGLVLVWIISWLVPGWIATPAGWILDRTNEMFISGPSGKLSSAQVKDATRYFQTMLRLYFPGLAGFALGSLLWLRALERGNRWARRVLPVALILGVAQLAEVTFSANPTVPKSFYTYRPPVLAHFQRSTEPYRFAYIFREPTSTTAPEAQQFLNFDSIPEARDLSPTAQIAFRDRLLLARASMLTGAEGSFNIDVEGSYPLYIYEFWRYALRELPDPRRVECLLGRTNVRYLIARMRQRDGPAREVAPIFNGSSEPSYLYENPCVAPRAYVAANVFYSSNARQTLTRMSAPDFDEQNEVVLAANSGAQRVRRGGGSEAQPYFKRPAGRVAILDRQPNAVRLSAELPRPGYVVLFDRFDPNWHATVDGREVPILRANHLFRAVYSEAGRHEIYFYYRQEGLKAGIVISIVTLAFLAAIYIFDPRSNLSTTR